MSLVSVWDVPIFQYLFVFKACVPNHWAGATPAHGDVESGELAATGLEGRDGVPGGGGPGANVPATTTSPSSSSSAAAG